MNGKYAKLDPFVTCPYNASHRIRKSVLPRHLVRCGRNNASFSTKRCCPFDAFHIVEDIEYESHIINCASSGNVRRYQYDLEPQRELGNVSLETVKKLTVPVMKDWSEEYVQPYDPWESTKDRNIIRCVIGGTKSFRKKFRLAERERIRALEEGRTPDITASQLSKCMKTRVPPKYVNTSQLVPQMQKLCLEDIDALLNNVDVSKLCISDITTIVSKAKYISEMIDKMLVQKFKNLILQRFKEEIF